MLTSGKALPHAFLFYGPDGVGKRTVATAFGRGILCANGQFGGCGMCEPCKEAGLLGQPRDLLMIAPNETGIIPIDAAHDITAFLSRTPGVASRKVVMVDEADRMTEEAKNSLLKTMEEPPADSTLILVSAKPGRIGETLRSRLIPVRFSLVSDEAMSGMPSDIRALAAGKPGKAVRLMEDPDLRKHLAGILKRAKALPAADAAEKIAFAQELAEESAMLDTCLSYWLDMFHRALHETDDAERRGTIGRNARAALAASLLLEDTETSQRLLVENMLLAFR